MTMPDTPVSSSSENVYIIVHTKDHGRYESDAMPMVYQEAHTIPSEILKTSSIQVFQTPDNR